MSHTDLIFNIRLEDILSNLLMYSLLPWKAFIQSKWDGAGELTRECVMPGEHVSVPIEAASITVLVFTWWEMLLGSSSPSSSERMDVWLWSHQPWTSEAAPLLMGPQGAIDWWPCVCAW